LCKCNVECGGLLRSKRKIEDLKIPEEEERWHL
jgi:hypothetical protein